MLIALIICTVEIFVQGVEHLGPVILYNETLIETDKNMLFNLKLLNILSMNLILKGKISEVYHM